MEVLQKICEIVHFYEKNKFLNFGVMKVLKCFDSF